jgi:basic membrane protein A
MLKRVDSACYLLIKSVVDGTFEGGSKQYLTIADNGVSLTDMSVMKEALGDQFPDEILTKIQELQDKIVSGEIVVENYEGFGPNN